MNRDYVKNQLKRELETLEDELRDQQEAVQLAEDACMVKNEMKKLKKQVRSFIIIILKYSVMYKNIHFCAVLALTDFLYFRIDGILYHSSMSSMELYNI